MVYFEPLTHYLSKWLQKIVKLVRIASSHLEYQMDIIWPHIRFVNIAVYYERWETWDRYEEQEGKVRDGPESMKNKGGRG